MFEYGDTKNGNGKRDARLWNKLKERERAVVVWGMEFNNSGNGKTEQLNFWNHSGLNFAPGLDFSAAKMEQH